MIPKETFTVLPTPTRLGYDFVGWTGSNGNVPQMTVTLNYENIGDKEFEPHFVKKQEVEQS